MPQIIVTADRRTDRGEGAVTLRERITSSDFESETFARRLVERLGWAIDDAHAAEQATPEDRPDLEPEHHAEETPAAAPERELSRQRAPA